MEPLAAAVAAGWNWNWNYAHHWQLARNTVSSAARRPNPLSSSGLVQAGPYFVTIGLPFGQQWRQVILRSGRRDNRKQARRRATPIPPPN